MTNEIKLEKRKPTFDYILNDLALDSLMFRVVNGIASSQDKFDFDYQVKLMQKEITRLNKIIDELEKWVNIQIDFLKSLGTIPNAKNIVNEHTTMVLTYQNILYKLQELKEEGK